MAATALVCGGDPWKIINLKDQTEFTVMDAIVNRAREFQDVRDKNLATEIANKIAKIL